MSKEKNIPIKELSKLGLAIPHHTTTPEFIMASALMRIADSLEANSATQLELLNTISKLKNDLSKARKNNALLFNENKRLRHQKAYIKRKFKTNNICHTKITVVQAATKRLMNWRKKLSTTKLKKRTSLKTD